MLTAIFFVAVVWSHFLLLNSYLRGIGSTGLTCAATTFRFFIHYMEVSSGKACSEPGEIALPINVGEFPDLYFPSPMDRACPQICVNFMHWIPLEVPFPDQEEPQPSVQFLVASDQILSFVGSALSLRSPEIISCIASFLFLHEA